VLYISHKHLKDCYNTFMQRLTLSRHGSYAVQAITHFSLVNPILKTLISPDKSLGFMIAHSDGERHDYNTIGKVRNQIIYYLVNQAAIVISAETITGILLSYFIEQLGVLIPRTVVIEI